jgi:acylphosphatase
MKTLELTVIGHVQGVFYRAEMKAMADELGVKGEVRNNADGSVSCIIQGDEEHVEALVDWCKKGPELSKVEKVHIILVENPVAYSRFTIMY